MKALIIFTSFIFISTQVQAHPFIYHLEINSKLYYNITLIILILVFFKIVKLK